MEKISVTWKLVLAYTILLLICILLLSSCGTKKKIVDTDIHKSEETEKSVSEGKVKKDSESKEESSTKEQNAITDERQEQRITELFNENGSLKSRITELLNRKTVDNSTKESNSLKTYKTHLDSIITNKIYRQVIIQDNKIHSDLDKDSTWVKNLGSKNIAFGLAILAVILVVYNNWTKIKDWLRSKIVR